MIAIEGESATSRDTQFAELVERLAYAASEARRPVALDPAAAELAINLGKNGSEPTQIEPLDIQPLQIKNSQ